MIRSGLVEEVRALADKGLNTQSVSMQGLGYKEMIDHLEGKMSLEEAVDLLKNRTRHYAKRQITWFTRQGDPEEVRREEHGGDNTLIAEYIAERVAEHYRGNEYVRQIRN